MTLPPDAVHKKVTPVVEILLIWVVDALPDI
jgi:hypothetical protein